MLKNELRQLALELVEYHKFLLLSNCSTCEHERRRWSIYWDIRLGEKFFENSSFLINLKSDRESLIFYEYCGLKDRIYIE